MSWNPVKSFSSAVGGIFHKIGDTIKRDPITKIVLAPVRSLAAADPIIRRITTGKVGTNNERIAGGVHALYSADPVAKNVGVKEDDAVKAAKIAGAIAAIYFTAGAASSAMGAMGGGAAASGAAAGGGTAAASGAAAGGGTAAAGATTGGIMGTGLTSADLLAIGSLTASAATLNEARKLQPGEPPPAPETPDPLGNPAVDNAASRAKRKAQADMGRFDTILTGPLGLSEDLLGGTGSRKKTILGA